MTLSSQISESVGMTVTYPHGSSALVIIVAAYCAFLGLRVCPNVNTTDITMSSQLVSTLAWEKVVVENSIPERSSHGVSVVGDILVVFGGENVPRTPFDNQVHALDLSSPNPRSWTVLQPSGGEAPEPRVAHAQCTLGDNIAEELVMLRGGLGMAHDNDGSETALEIVQHTEVKYQHVFHQDLVVL